MSFATIYVTEWKFIWEFQDLTAFFITPLLSMNFYLTQVGFDSDSDKLKKICLAIQPLISG